MALPKFFSIDIGNHSVKAALVSGIETDRPKLERIGGAKAEINMLSDSSEQGMKKVAEQLSQLHNNLGISTKNCVAAIPESPVFSRLLTVPKVEEEDKFEEAVMWQLKSLIPVALDEVDVAFLEVAERKNQQNQQVIDVYAVAAPKTLTSRFQKIAELAGLNLLALETESLANTRAVSRIDTYKEANVMIFDFGAQGTNLILSSKGVPVFAQTVSTGSDALTKAVAAEYGIEIPQAEQYKQAYGIDFNKGEGKIARALEPVMKILLSEMMRTLTYFREKIGNQGASQILMVGEAARLPGLAEYLHNNLKIDAVLFDPTIGLQISNEAQKYLGQTAPVGYSVALGLALKDS